MLRPALLHARLQTPATERLCCPQVEGNPCLAYAKMVVFPWFGRLTVSRKEAAGGDRCNGCTAARSKYCCTTGSALLQAKCDVCCCWMNMHKMPVGPAGHTLRTQSLQQTIQPRSCTLVSHESQ